jgi:hypothetical protein
MGFQDLIAARLPSLPPRPCSLPALVRPRPA